MKACQVLLSFEVQNAIGACGNLPYHLSTFFEYNPFFMCTSPALSLPTNVEDVCPNIPSLEKLMEEIVELAESGIRYTQMPHVMEVILPMLCSYMSRWWEHGPENNPERAEMCCTALNSEHMNTLLGNILKIIYNNLGIDEGAWMKRLAGKNQKKTLYPFNLFYFQKNFKYIN